MDAKASWGELEPQLHAAEQSAKEVTSETTRSFPTETVKKLSSLLAKLA